MIDMRYNNGPQSAARMVASYGVYNDTSLRSEEDEDGFIPRANVYRGVIVNASGDSSVVRSSQLQQPSPAAVEASSRCGWCLNAQSTTPNSSGRDSCLISWCRPTILLLILVLLVVVFVLVSGILLYYNCTLESFYVDACSLFPLLLLSCPTTGRALIYVSFVHLFRGVSDDLRVACYYRNRRIASI